MEDDSYEFHDDDPLDHSPDEHVCVEDSLTVLLNELGIGQRQPGFAAPTEDDDERLRSVHERMAVVVARETDDAKRRRLRRCFPYACCLREQLWYARRMREKASHSGMSPAAPAYSARLSAALDKIVKDSFDEEMRKTSILLGVVEAVADIVVCDVAAWGATQANEHRVIRKLSANALTNLTFGQVASKHRLCHHPDFIDTVVWLLKRCDNLVHVYAGLVRNLSWLADAEMSGVLAATVVGLVDAAVHASARGDDSSTRATLSALWNLASHCQENKRTICYSQEFLQLLLHVIGGAEDGNTAVVESASGILKYACQVLGGLPDRQRQRQQVAHSLARLLSSASFTVVANALGALHHLLAKDAQLHQLLLRHTSAMAQLQVLRNSAREDIRAAVKLVLNHLNQPRPSGAHSQTTTPRKAAPASDDWRMAVSMRPSAESSHSPRLLPLRGTTTRTGMPSFEQRCSSLPRPMRQPSPMKTGGAQQQQQSGGLSSTEDHSFAAFAPPPVEDETELDSTRVTRSGSACSLGSEEPANASGWESVLDTAANSARASPISLSDLPDSPTQYMPGMGGAVLKTGQPQQKRDAQSETGSAGTATGASDTTPVSSFQFVAPDPVADEYGETEGGSNLLERSIEAVMPQRRQTQQQSNPVSFDDDDDNCLAEMIESALPTPRRAATEQSARSRRADDGDRLLMDCILSAMPAPSPRRQQQPAVRQASSDSDEFFREVAGEEEEDVMRLPGDVVIEAEALTIDCSAHVSPGRFDATPKKTPSRLPAPKAIGMSGLRPPQSYNRGSVSPRRGAIPQPIKKTPTKAAITPYNYRQPEMTVDDEKAAAKASSKQMLVTTV